MRKVIYVTKIKKVLNKNSSNNKNYFIKRLKKLIKKGKI